MGRRTFDNVGAGGRQGWPAWQARSSGRSYYGVDLDDGPLVEEAHVYHPLRDAVTIVTTSIWLAVHAVLWS